MVNKISIMTVRGHISRFDTETRRNGHEISERGKGRKRREGENEKQKSIVRERRKDRTRPKLVKTKMEVKRHHPKMARIRLVQAEATFLHFFIV